MRLGNNVLLYDSAVEDKLSLIFSQKIFLIIDSTLSG